MRSVEKKPRVRAWIWWAGICTFLFGLSQFVESFDRRFVYASLVFLLAAFYTGARALWIQLRNNGATSLNANLKASAIWVPGSIICVYLFCWQYFQPRPHLKLVIDRSNQLTSGVDDLALTNEFLVFKKGPHLWSDVKGFLVVPISPQTSNCTLKFCVNNDSPVPIGSAQIIFTIPRNLHCKPELGWDILYSSDEDADCYGFRLKSDLLSGDQEPLRGLHFEDLTDGTMGITKIDIRGGDLIEVHFAFWIGFTTKTNVKTIHITTVNVKPAGQGFTISVPTEQVEK